MRRVLLAALALAAGACASSSPVPETAGLDGVTSWAIQLQGLDRPGAVNRLAGAKADLLVVDRVSSVRGREDWPMAAAVRQLRASPGAARERKLCLAYVNVGQAEEYRTYWSEGWRPPGPDGPGEPDFLLAADPLGWQGNYPVAYWDPQWREILESLVDGAVGEGFDGMMLDWVTGWSAGDVAPAADRAEVDPAEAMAELIRDLAARARASRPGFLVLLNDGAPLLLTRPGLASTVDGVLREGVWFTGAATGDWNSPDASDRPASETTSVLTDLRAARNLGVAVFVLDYASTPENRRLVEESARAHGFLPCTSRTPLDRLPDHAFPRQPTGSNR